MNKDKNDNVMVSIVMITYNQDRYIKDAVESILNQECNFKIELIIADDKSQDNTEKLILEIIKHHKKGHFIKYTKHKINKGIVPNIMWALGQSSGKYIAVCEGDDFWTDSLKLQKQVDFLNKHSDFSMTFHSVNILNDGNTTYSYPIPKKDIITFNDILFNHFIPTCSLVFRAEYILPYYPWLNKCIQADIPLELYLADKGRAKYFDKKMGTYRKQGQGITASISQKKLGRKSLIIIYKNLIKVLSFKRLIPLTIVLLKTYLGYIVDVFRK